MTGTCDLRQYEHGGLHEEIKEHGQKLPPFPCVNWKPALPPGPKEIAEHMEMRSRGEV